MRRREFFKTALGAAAALGVPSLVPRSVFGAHAPSERIHVGFIGLGNQSTIDLPAFLGHDDVQVLAVCDVNTASYGYNDPKHFQRQVARGPDRAGRGGPPHGDPVPSGQHRHAPEAQDPLGPGQ